MNKFIHNKNIIILIIGIIFLFNSCAEFDSIISFENYYKPTDTETILEPNMRRYPKDNSLHLPPLVEFIVDYSNTRSVKYAADVRKVCDYTKIPFETLNIKNWNANLSISPSTRVLIVLETKKLNNESVAKITEFIATGGMLFIPTLNEDKRFAFLLGLIPEAEYNVDDTSKGIKFDVPFLPGMKNKTIMNDMIMYGLTKENFKSDIKILARIATSNLNPAIIENTVGQGKVIYFNFASQFEKSDRGLLFSAILNGLESIPYPIANTSTIFLDDFPSPVYDTKLEPIKSEMNLSIADFVKNVWWPDMLTLAKKHNISYCAVPAFDYNVKTQPPFLFEQWDAIKIKADNKVEPLSSWLMRDCLKHGHELGFHGYNHVSLTKKEWKNLDFIVTSLEGVHKKWKVSNFERFPVSYIPPSNVIDDLGINYLKKGMPSLKYLCSLYLGELHEGGFREYDYDPFHPNLFDYPRISSGFYLSPTEEYFINSLFLYTGIWNHFVHPDDVFQVPSPFNKSAGNYDLRNGRELGWKTTKGKKESLYSEFDEVLQRMKNTFPHIRFLNASDGGDLTLDWRANQYLHREDENNYTVEKLRPEKSITEKQYWYLYASDLHLGQVENQLKKMGHEYHKTPFLNGSLISILTSKSRLRLDNLKINPSPSILGQIKMDWATFQQQRRIYDAGEIWVDRYEENLAKEIESLRLQMIKDETINYDIWNQYATYLSWSERGAEVWKLLEEHCIIYPTRENVMYSKELEKIIWYPNELVKEKWTNAQLIVSPNDIELLNNYVANYYTPENQEKIKNALIKLLQIDTSDQTLFNYMQHLLWYEPETALVELDKIEPSEEFRELADNIMWLYANNKQMQKAYDWSFYSNDIDMATKLYWLYELQQYPLLVEEFNRYRAQNPNDYKVQAVMVGLYRGMGDFKEAWILAEQLPESKEKEQIQKEMNKDVVYVDDLLKQYLSMYHPSFFLKDVKQNLDQESRLKFGNYAETENEIQTNRDRRAALKTVHSYNWLDKNKNTHRVAATYTELYPINRDVSELDPISPQNNPDNQFLRVFGVEYRYKNPFSYDKLQYWGRARVEMDSNEWWYMQLGMGASFSKNKNFSSAQVNLFPAETAPGYAKEIYQLKTNLYHSAYFFKKINMSISIESNYYTRSKQNDDLETDNAINGIATLKLGWDHGDPRKNKFIPYLETSASKGTANFSGGYPFWMLEERLFGGGGVEWKYGLEQDKFRINIDAGHFVDTFADEFQRFTGTINYRFLNYWVFNGSFQWFNQSEFYSNTFNFGLKYYFKERKDFKK